MEPTAAETRPENQWAELAYEAIAPVYDDFTSHHDYELWLGNLLPKLEHHRLQGSRLLDVGCGTGKSFIPMLERGWEVTACDISESMLALARQKVGKSADLSVADMRELPELGEFDLVWALDDAVNYLLDREELEAALTGMARNLAPHGLLMFDVNTLNAYRNFFAETQVVEQGGWRMTWNGLAGPNQAPGSISESRLEVEASGPSADNSGDDATRFREGVETHVHRQRHFPEAEVLAAIERAGLKCLDVFGHGHDAVPHQPVDELDHMKAVYIARLS